MQKMRHRLQADLAPEHLSIDDESHLHRGHAGARDGRGHFAVSISAAAFAGKPPLACHRLVYKALGDMMETDIHALRLDTQVATGSQA
ncbi:MAG: BolA family protein [Lysobacterales bacterium]